MSSKFGSWWQKIQQKIRRHPARSVVIIGATVVGSILIIVILGGYWFNWTWTGFAGKTLWDWLGLLSALAIPIVVGFGAAWFSVQQGKVSNAENKDNQRETAFQAYIDKMSELLLDEKLRESAKEDEIRKIARVRTLAVLSKLDPVRKGSVLQFLYEAGLVDKSKCIIALNGANLDGADLNAAHLEGANLDGISLKKTDLTAAFLHAANLRGAIIDKAFLDFANLSDANLSRVTMRGTKLRKAILRGAILNEAILEGADLKDATGITIEELENQAESLKDATMPDGTIHP